jgi:hypothetical protein
MRWGGFGLLIGLLSAVGSRAQDYHAIEGSSFAGGLGAANNPASIVNTPYPWDITVFSVQLQNTSNAYTFYNLSFLSHGDSIGYNYNNGLYKRYAAVNFNIHLFNVRLALGRKQAIAFGANFRSYGTLKTGVFNYNDTIQNLNQFFGINGGTTYNANLVSSSWLELFGTYARTIWDDETGRLNAGLTLRAMRGISGAFAQLQNGTVQRSVSGIQTIYLLNAGSARYGYSSNYDTWKNGNSTSQNLKDFLGHSRSGAALDLGFEYLVKSQAVTNSFDGDTYYDYEWKIGVSLLDIGQNSYKYGTQSRTASLPKSNVSDSVLSEKFGDAGSLAHFNDSLATIVNSIAALNGLFNVRNPTRLVINVDRPLQGQFAINGDLSLNLGGTNNGKTLFAKEINLLTMTPRWETKRLGAYLPVLITTEGKVWIGGAVKAGPLLLGIHNWANVFSKDKIQNGGFYLALVIRPGQGTGEKEDKRYSCPKY